MPPASEDNDSCPGGDSVQGDASEPRWAELATEQRATDSSELDARETIEVVTLLLEADRDGIDRALEQRQAITSAAVWFADALAAGGRVLFAGAGTSGRLGVLEAAECPPTFGTDPRQIVAAMAGGEDAVFRAKEGSEDRADLGRQAVADIDSHDLVIGLSASSVTPFTLGALEAARQRGARTILLTCATATGLQHHADLVIGLDTGPEILTGSTRLKAGSATKAALNAMSTAAMVRLGKVYDNLMVDLKPTSAKLVDRSARIVAAAGQVSIESARELLERADGEVKTAIVMARLDLEPSAARKLLQDSSGHVRAALS
jgi:N-acetylmuramic acid 6-phosphate etherase